MNTPTSQTTPPTPVDMGQVRSMVGRAVRAAALSEEPADGLPAALAVVKIAQQQAYRFVIGLRGEGTSWREAADLLEIPWSDQYSRPERAYELVLGPDPDGPRSFRVRNVYWHCGGPGGCGKYITDRGPYNGHPVDNEDGHADGCRRHAAEGEAYEREREEREERDRVADAAMVTLVDDFGQETVRRARWVLAHGGQYQGWSTSETLAVALALHDDGRLKEHGYSSREEAAERVFRGMSNPLFRGVSNAPGDGGRWLATVRAAATGQTDD